jgi:hypothetical protein
MKRVVGRMIKLRWEADQKVRVPSGSLYYGVSTDGADPYLVVGEPEEGNGQTAIWLISLLRMGEPHTERGSIFGSVLWRENWRAPGHASPYLSFFGWVQEDDEPSTGDVEE